MKVGDLQPGGVLGVFNVSLSWRPTAKVLGSDCVLMVCLEHWASVRVPSWHRDSPGLSPWVPQHQERAPRTRPPLRKDALAAF